MYKYQVKQQEHGISWLTECSVVISGFIGFQESLDFHNFFLLHKHTHREQCTSAPIHFSRHAGASWVAQLTWSLKNCSLRLYWRLAFHILAQDWIWSNRLKSRLAWGNGHVKVKLQGSDRNTLHLLHIACRYFLTFFFTFEMEHNFSPSQQKQHFSGACPAGPCTFFFAYTLSRKPENRKMLELNHMKSLIQVISMTIFCFCL